MSTSIPLQRSRVANATWSIFVFEEEYDVSATARPFIKEPVSGALRSFTCTDAISGGQPKSPCVSDRNVAEMMPAASHSAFLHLPCTNSYSFVLALKLSGGLSKLRNPEATTGSRLAKDDASEPKASIGSPDVNAASKSTLSDGITEFCCAMDPSHTRPPQGAK
jgi:hypothetical protein